MCLGLLVKYASFLRDFNEIWIFFRKIFEEHSNVKDSSKFVHADGQT